MSLGATEKPVKTNAFLALGGTVQERERWEWQSDDTSRRAVNVKRGVTCSVTSRQQSSF